MVAAVHANGIFQPWRKRLSAVALRGGAAGGGKVRIVDFGKLSAAPTEKSFPFWERPLPSCPLLLRGVGRASLRRLSVLQEGELSSPNSKICRLFANAFPFFAVSHAEGTRGGCSDEFACKFTSSYCDREIS